MFLFQRGRVYIVEKILTLRKRPLYSLTGLKGETIAGTFYRESLTLSPLKPDRSSFWHISKIHYNRVKYIKRKKCVLCSFLFYPRSYDEYIPLSQIRGADVIDK